MAHASARQRRGVRWQRCTARACIGDTAFGGRTWVIRTLSILHRLESGVALRFPPHSKTLSRFYHSGATS